MKKGLSFSSVLSTPPKPPFKLTTFFDAIPYSFVSFFFCGLPPLLLIK